MPGKLITPDMIDLIAEVNRREYDHPDLGTLRGAELHARSLPSFEALVGKPITADCNRSYRAVHSSGNRPLSVIRGVLIHSEEAPTALSAASWFTSQASAGSTQLAVDDGICYRCLDDDQIPWGAPGTNYNFIHIEQAGYAVWFTTLWSKKHRQTMMRCAYKTAFHLHKYGNPPIWLDVAALKAGKHGVTDHRTATAAYGGTHTDPGVNYPRLLFMTMVKGYYYTKTRR